MSQLETSLILTGDARGLVVATKQGEQGIDQLGQSVLGLGRKQKSAQASADVFNREIDQQVTSVTQLRSSLDPLFVANQRLEAGQTTLTRAVRSGIINNREYENTLELLQAQHRQTTSAIELQSVATRRLTTSTAGGAGGMQNFSYQLQDIFTQVGMGVPLMISLGQQAPQILSGFGTVGAIAGVAAAAIFPLTAVIFGLGYESKQAAKKVKTSSELMQDAFSAIGDAQSILKTNSVDNLDAMRDKYGEVTRSVLTLQQAQNELVLQRAFDATRTGLNSTFNEGAFAELDQADQLRQADVQERKDIIEQALGDIKLNFDVESAQAVIATMQEEIADLDAGVDLQQMFEVDEATLSRILILKDEIKSAFAAENIEAALVPATEFREIIGSLPEGPLRKSYQGILDMETAMREAVHAAKTNEEVHQRLEALAQRIGDTDVSSNLSAGADQATRMANELGRAVSNAITLANQGVGQAERARINYEYRENPIGRAEALATSEFNSRTRTTGNTDGPIRAVLQREKEEFVGAAVEAERYNQSLQKWRKEQSAAGRTSGGGGGGKGRGRSSEDRVLKDIAKQMDRLAPSYERDLAALEEWRVNALSTLNPAREGFEEFAEDVDIIFRERLAQAYRDDLDRRSDWAAGVERGFMDVNENMTTWADVGEDVAKKWSSGLEDAFVKMGRTGKFEVGSLVDYTLEQFQRMAFQQSIQPGIEAGFGFLTDFIGGLFPSAGAAAGAAGSTPLIQSHAGSTIGTGGVRRSYGTGSPLRADERLTVTTLGQRVFTPEQIGNGATVVDALASAAANGGGGSGGVIFSPSISIENRGSTPVEGEIEEQRDGQGGRSYKLVLADEVGSAMTQPGGGARKTLQRGGFKQKRAQR